MRISVISIGSELLRGDILNTNLAYLGQQGQCHGVILDSETCVPDELDAIRNALHSLLRPGDLVVTIGGLGPTCDDLTRVAVADVLRLPLVEDATIAAGIRNFLGRRDVTIPAAAAAAQSLVLRGAEIMPNANGTAPGLWCTREDGAAVAMLPGPPTEFKAMVDCELMPRIVQRYPSLASRPRRLLVCGLPESVVEARTMKALAGIGDIELAFCAKPVGVDVHLMHHAGADTLNTAEERLRAELVDYVLPPGCSDICADIGERLVRAGETLATAESCTAGLVGAALTGVPGASRWYVGGAITYANETKVERLGVRPNTLARFGAVSTETVTEMLCGVRREFGAGAAIAVSGIAGPGGGSDEKPVGTVILGVSVGDESAVVQPCLFPGDRETVRTRAVGRVLVMLRQCLLQSIS